jgi:hypothetical protein
MEPFRLAHSIAEKGKFADPYPLHTGPSSAHSAPAFPALLALLMHVFGDGVAGMYAIKLTATIVLSIQLALFPVFSEALGMGQISGIIAAILWIGAKVGTGETYYRAGHTWQPVASFVAWESFYCSILVAIAACYFRRYLDSSVSGSRRLAWILGCVIGVSMLISPTVGIIFIGFVALLLWRDKLAIFKGSNLSNPYRVASDRDRSSVDHPKLLSFRSIYSGAR